jgi:hypothetical protein
MVVPAIVEPRIVPTPRAMPSIPASPTPAHIDIYIHIGTTIVEISEKLIAYKHNYLIGSRYNNT